MWCQYIQTILFTHILLQNHGLDINIANPLNAELNPICHFLALLGPHPILHVSRTRVNEDY
jgi:hypothetical protein